MNTNKSPITFAPEAIEQLAGAPITVLSVPPTRNGDYLNTLEQWGNLPEVLSLPDLARFLGHALNQNWAAILKTLEEAILSDQIEYYGLHSSGRWERGMMRVLIPRGANKPKVRQNSDGSINFALHLERGGNIHSEAMGMSPSEALFLLSRRGRRVPEQLRHLLPVEDEAAAAPHNQNPRPVGQQRHQENEILRVIGELGYDPKALPKSPPGKPGVRAAVRARLNFSKCVFDKAWERLQQQGDIKASP